MVYPVHEWNKWYSAQGFGVKTDYGYHEGVDINLKTGGDTDLGQELLAVADGEITSVESHTKIPSFGKHLHLKVETPLGIRWFNYCHCQDILVSEGTKVKEGQLIAHLGKTGTTVAHLHFACKNQPTGVDAVAKTLEDLAKWEDPIAFIEKINALPVPATSSQNNNLDVEKKINDLSEKVVNNANQVNILNDSVNSLVKKINDIQTDITEIYKDRDTLSVIQQKLTENTNSINNVSVANTKSTTELKSEIRALGETTDDKLTALSKRIKVVEDRPVSLDDKIKIVTMVGKSWFIGKIVS
jgi:hypothetical protein